jgi:hypothetical protein
MKKCRHGNQVCSKCTVVTDDGKRFSDAVRSMLVFIPFEVASHGWVAISLADGSSDYIVYPSKKEAVEHQSNEFRFLYFPLGQAYTGFPPLDAQVLLDYYRSAISAGFRQEELKAPQLIMPVDRMHSW